MPSAFLTSIPHTFLTILLFYSSLSRLTHGTSTPSYYAFQCIRHMGHDLPIGSCDAIFATLLCFKKTRFWTAVILTVFLVVPVVEGLKMRGVRGTMEDMALLLLGLGVFGVEFRQRRR